MSILGRMSFRQAQSEVSVVVLVTDTLDEVWGCAETVR